MKFSIKDFFSKCDQIRKNLRVWSHLPNKSLMENFICCAVIIEAIALQKYSNSKIQGIGNHIRKWPCIISIVENMTDTEIKTITKAHNHDAIHGLL